jgi:hypothetical protein
MYVLKVGEEQNNEFQTRADAVQAARDLSRARSLPVRVLRDGGIERMIYRNGNLLEGAFITVEQRRRTARFT